MTRIPHSLGSFFPNFLIGRTKIFPRKSRFPFPLENSSTGTLQDIVHLSDRCLVLLSTTRLLIHSNHLVSIDIGFFLVWVFDMTGDSRDPGGDEGCIRFRTFRILHQGERPSSVRLE